MQLDQAWVMQQGDDAMLLHSIDTFFAADLPARIGIAVSGGGDSVALLHLFARWSAQTGHPIAAVTLDHGLRAESRAEAEGVAKLCQSLGVPHDILIWQRPEGAGNTAALARDARYELMAEWALANDIGARHGVIWCRPLWQQTREGLREYLRRNAVLWVEDPSNDDPKYMRTRARAMLPQLADLGIDAQAIHHSAFALRQAQAALAHYTLREAQRYVIRQDGDLLLPEKLTADVPTDIERRITAAALQWIGSNPYPPRKIFAGSLAPELKERSRKTLAGCLIMKRKGHYHITREYNAVKDLVTPTDVVWDTRGMR